MSRDAGLKGALARELERARRSTFDLLDPLDDDAVHRQHSLLMSPLVWDLGHIGNFEELWLLRALGERGWHDADLDRIYNPFDNPRWARADLPLLARDDATEYVTEIRAAVLRWLGNAALDRDDPLCADGYVWRMVAQHEAQHQETMLQAIDLRHDHAAPPFSPVPPPAAPRRVDDTARVVIDRGAFWMGAGAPPDAPQGTGAHAAQAGAYDNERPRHRVDVDAFALDRFPATARRFAAFVSAGGYRDDRWWSARGRAWLAETGERAPQGWLPDGDGGWLVRRFGRVVPLDPREIVTHVSFFEAEAFARWCGGRLPTETEWEKAAAHDPATGRARTWPWGENAPDARRCNIDRRRWGPSAAGTYLRGASAYGVEQLIGDGYEWTSSDFVPYRGYRTFPYPEYSEVFFGGDYKVLRGASWATRPAVARNTFRNWDHPQRRQIFSAVRVAYDLPSVAGPGGP